MEKYEHKNIEEKWQKKWSEDELYKVSEDASKPKQYILDFFPYPSGSALHVGHPKGYVATDIYSRYLRMKGYNVLHPFGWDAFGLPAENFAIKNKVHPEVATAENVESFKNQIERLGLNYDWSREINTTDPSYYKWTQWIFLQMFKKGLAYESNEPINWCPSCQTGLANEDLEDGKCERCGTLVEKKKIRQWVLKITKYADRLLKDLEELEWPANIKEMQRAWIGKSEGLIFRSPVRGMKLELETFSAHFEACYADTFVTIAPDHPILGKLIAGVENEDDIRNKIEDINLKRLSNKYGEGEVEGVFTGRYMQDRVTGKDLPIWVASFVISDYGTGVVRSSAYDSRDLAFAQKYKIPLVEINPEVDREKFEKVLIDAGHAKKATMYRLRDWVFSRQRYWGEPIPLIHCQGGPARPNGRSVGCGVVPVPEEDLPVKLPKVEHYEPTGTGESPLASIDSWVNVPCPNCGGKGMRETNTMPQWAGSCWYYLRFMDAKNETGLVSKENEKYWAPVDLYVGGAEHATRHLIYARFWHKFLYDIDVVSTKEPFAKLETVGLIWGADGRKMGKRYGNVVDPNTVVDRFGADSFRLYEMFLGPFGDTVLWNDSGIVGPRRFLERVWALKSKVAKDAPDALSYEMSETVKKVSADIGRFRFNTAISSLMVFVRAMGELDKLPITLYKNLIKLLAPFAPHITEEIWSLLGYQGSIHTSTWPVADESAQIVLSDLITLPVQIDGKIRGKIVVSRGAGEEEIREAIEANKSLARWCGADGVKKLYYKEGKIVSLDTKGRPQTSP
jgi:leucyl-tRNA synthetase